MRVLVTGSRSWPNALMLENKLEQWWLDHNCPTEVTLVTGGCPKGADRFAEEYAAARGWTIERHEAQWDVYGKAAGMVRNQEMVDLGADTMLAFIHEGSKGATHCYQMARKAGLPTRRYNYVNYPAAAGELA